MALQYGVLMFWRQMYTYGLILLTVILTGTTALFSVYCVKKSLDTYPQIVYDAEDAVNGNMHCVEKVEAHHHYVKQIIADISEKEQLVDIILDYEF